MNQTQVVTGFKPLKESTRALIIRKLEERHIEANECSPEQAELTRITIGAIVDKFLETGVKITESSLDRL